MKEVIYIPQTIGQQTLSMKYRGYTVKLTMTGLVWNDVLLVLIPIYIRLSCSLNFTKKKIFIEKKFLYRLHVDYVKEVTCSQ